MRDAAEKLIYVGKAKNLRQRICSYKYLNPETASRKTIRLIHSVERISWETCASAIDAELRENFLLRTERPKFNRLNVYPAAYCFIGLRRISGTKFEICFSRERDEDTEWFGAFKPGAKFVYAALLRMIWILVSDSVALTNFPNGFFSDRPPVRFECSHAKAELFPAITNFLAGTDDVLVKILEALPEKFPGLSPFELQLLNDDREILTNFFARVTRRMRSVKSRFAISSWIEKDDLNDWLVRSRELGQPLA